ncbi:MAG: PEP-CTERM system TPR-repeat protein PrsT, partial [Candidatus Competibacteraceae bacterium]|nr:PEP-CTERM system TPR-repeat protein PrsT [Candidatus Competibacteraceae bacterium]
MARQHLTFPQLPRRLLIIALAASLWGCGGEFDLSETDYFQRAETAYHQGQFQAAAIDLKNALRLNPDNPGTRLLLGRIYLELDQGEAAEKELRRANSLGVTVEEIQPYLGQALLLQRKYQQLLEMARPGAYTQARDYAALMTLRGQAYLALDQLDQARQAFEEALDRHPEELEALLGLFVVALVNDDAQQAQDYLDRATQLAPDSPRVLLARGEQAFRQRDFAAARDYYRQAVETGTDDPKPHLGLAHALLALEQPQEAEAVLQPLIEALPDHPQVLYLRALAAYQQQDYRNALTHASQVLQRLPDDHLQSLFIAAASHYALKEMEQALVLLKKLAVRVPGNPQVQGMLTATQLALGQNQQVAETLVRAAEQNPDSGRLLAQAGALLVQGGELESGRKLLEQAQELDPQAVTDQSRTLLGLAKLQEGNYQEGIAELARVAEANPADPQPLLRLVAEQLRAGDYDNALAGVRTFQERFPDRPQSHLLEGILYGIQGRDEAAKEAFAKTLELEPGNPD